METPTPTTVHALVAAADPDARRLLSTSLQRLEHVEVVGSVGRPSDLALAVRRARPHLLYVHDALAGATWASVVDALPPSVHVVAVGLGRLDIGRLVPRPTREPAYPPRIMVPARGGIDVLDVEQIRYVEGAGGYVRLHAEGRVLLLREGLGDVAARLDPSRFVRIHRSVVVNAREVTGLRPCGRGEYAVHLSSGETLKLTRTYRDRISALLHAG